MNIDHDFIQAQLEAETDLQAAIEQSLQKPAALNFVPGPVAPPLPTILGPNDVRAKLT